MLYSSSWKSLYVMLPFLPFSDSLYFFSLTTSKTPFQPHEQQGHAVHCVVPAFG